MDRIAERAGASRHTFCIRFRRKAELFREVVRRLMESSAGTIIRCSRSR